MNFTRLEEMRQDDAPFFSPPPCFIEDVSNKRFETSFERDVKFSLIERNWK